MLKPTEHYTLALNAGSATLKWGLFSGSELTEVGRGVVERIGASASFTEWRLLGKVAVKHVAFRDHEDALRYTLKVLAWHHVKLELMTAVGHRIVHGGSRYAAPVLITPSVAREVARLAPLAPLHNPFELGVAGVAKQLLPQARHVAVFDTAWFANLPEAATTYAIPLVLAKRFGLKRYGFHGLSHSYVAAEASKRLGLKPAATNLVTCHLGSGASVAAVRSGLPIDTSMGFTPLEGLVMGTRSGDLDPGLVLYLIQRRKFSAAKLERLLATGSGLKGLSGYADMREVLVRAGYEVPGFKNVGRVTALEQKRAKLALAVFLHRLRKYIGAYAAILGRVDAIVFTGGIGERNEVVRNLTMQGLPGLKAVPVLPIATNEELALARAAISLSVK